MSDATQQNPFYDPQSNETITVKNEGQKVIYLLRKAFREGELFSSDDVAPDIQVMLNKPQEINEKDFKPAKEDQEFLKDVMSKVESGEIALFTPATLLNTDVYEALSDAGKAKADFDILNLLNKIREIHKLWEAGDRDSYQLFNLVKALRIIKERIEAVDGDVFII